MSYTTRRHVPPNGVMYRAVSYDKATGWPLSSKGPYSTKGPATAARSRLYREGVRVVVEICLPVWNVIEGSEYTP